MNELGEQVRYIKTLELGWNSYRAEPINLNLIDNMLSFSKKHNVGGCHVVPATQGGLNLEWHTDSGRVVVKFRNEGEKIYIVLKDRL